MSSTLRLSIIMVLLLATAALGLIAYNMSLPTPVVQVTENTPAPAPAAPAPAAPAPAPVTIGYFVAAHPLPANTLATPEIDFTVRSASPDSVPSGAIIDTPEVRIALRGSLVRTFLDTGSLITSQNVVRPRNRALSVLAPGTRAISIKVDTESGGLSLIWPGDYVDIVLTHSATPSALPPANKPSSASAQTPQPPSPPGVSETFLRNVRIIAIDQEAHIVSLQLAPEQVEKITVAEHLGKLSLAARAVEQHETVAARAVEQHETVGSGPRFSGDVSLKTDPQRGYIKVYNVRGLNSYRLYRCGSSGCDKVGEENSKPPQSDPPPPPDLPIRH
jgi:pilus assembly protein CpaB